MGVDAYVPCNCEKEGKICEHDFGELVSERISNWGGLRYFQDALAQIGLEYFPTLYAQLPNYSDGLMPPEACPAALKELEYFRKRVAEEVCPFLIDTKRDTVMQEYIEAYDGIFIMDGRGGFDIGFNADGLFLIDRKDRKIVFHAKRVEQQVGERGKQINPGLSCLGKYNGLDFTKVVYIDRDTGKKFSCYSAIKRMESYKQYRFSYPRYLHVEMRNLDPSEFDYIIKPLTKVFMASIETENPVYWC
ncbi:MAG: hypothetical protein ACFFDI_19640 [Promethearchaeota archaeon]